MAEDSAVARRKPAVVDYRNPGIALPVADALTEVLRSGARELLQQAIEAEVAAFVAQHRAEGRISAPAGSAQWLSAGADDSDRHR